MKYVCTICGYIYDDEKEKVKFEDLPDTWRCPMCGAAKSDFKKLEDEPINNEPAKNQNTVVDEENEDMEKLSIGQLAALCSNLARGCQKQYKFEEEQSFLKLSKYFSEITPAIENDSIDNLSNMIMSDINEKYVEVNNVAKVNGDRGAARVCVWGEKVTRMLNSLVNRYIEKGEEIFEDLEVWLCTTCGFIFIGKNPPEKCPVCKVPSSKFEKIEGGVL